MSERGQQSQDGTQACAHVCVCRRRRQMGWIAPPAHGWPDDGAAVQTELGLWRAPAFPGLLLGTVAARALCLVLSGPRHASVSLHTPVSTCASLRTDRGGPRPCEFDGTGYQDG